MPSPVHTPSWLSTGVPTLETSPYPPAATAAATKAVVAIRVVLLPAVCVFVTESSPNVTADVNVALPAELIDIFCAPSI